MGKYRIYPEKSNTLIEGTNINTGENEVTELWYGQEGISRYLVKFDIELYKTQYLQGYVPHISATTVEFNMINCYPIFERGDYSDAVPATSVEVEVRAINTPWDSGVGHNFYGNNREDGYSNWYSATTTTPWSGHGGDFSDLLCSQTLDKGNEDISCVVTNTAVLEDAFSGTNNGLMVKYTSEIEALSATTQSILKFYTNNAQTIYKQPYIEINWDNQVKDERDEIGHELTKRLYFYLKYNDVFSSANDISGVTITFDNPSYVDEFISPSAITEQYPGVYYFNWTPPAHEPGSQTAFYDTWSVQFTSGNAYTEIQLSGDMHGGETNWDYTQTDVLEAVNYAITMPTLSDHYCSGNILYLDVAVYEQYTSNRIVVKNMEYKISLIDGGNGHDFTMVDWSPVSYTRDINGFPVNTNWFHFGYTYEIKFRYSANGAISKTADDRFRFKIIESS